jgi:exodeoxyribonuclease-3
MRICSFNANGLRSAASKGFFDWFAASGIDVLCVQETKAQEHQLADALFRPAGWHVAFRDASTKKGYSGVAVYSRAKPDAYATGLGWAPFDEEGRWLEARFGNLSVISLYLPSGSSGDERQGFKFEVMRWFRPQLQALLASGRDVVVCGDWNIAHTPKDIRNAKSNEKNSGFLPEERAWLTALLEQDGWVDAYRGGASAARRVPRTWAGASTTSWSAPVWRRG